MQIELNIDHLPEVIQGRIMEAVGEYFADCSINGMEPDPDEIFELVSTIQLENKYED